MISFAPLQLDAIEFLTARTGIEFGFTDFTDPRWFCATARRPDATLQAVLVGEFKQPWNCHLTMAVEDIRAATPRVMMAIFVAIFSRAKRITVIVPPDNERSLKQLHRLGFVYEGFLRRGFDGTRDALLFGMLPEDSVWLERARIRAARRRAPPPIIIGGENGRRARPA